MRSMLLAGFVAFTAIAATAISPASDRSAWKLRTGKRLYSGSGPAWMTLQSSASVLIAGDHGARQSSTRITSASLSHGSGSEPTDIG